MEWNGSRNKFPHQISRQAESEMTNVYEKIVYLFIQNLAHAVICCISYRCDTFMCTWSREKDEIDIYVAVQRGAWSLGLDHWAGVCIDKNLVNRNT